MEFVKNDGGKTSYGFYHEKDDCVVRAVANAYEIPYDWAHAKLKNLGRVDSKPTYNLPHKMKKIGYKFHIDRPHMTIKTFLKKYKTGNYIVRIRNHAFAVKNGVLHDSFIPRLGSHITNVWLIK